MAYSKVLKKIIANTNYTQEEVAQKCTELGTKVSRTYITKLLSGEAKAPKEEITRAIAKVCDADERILVMEGYIDKAPKEIIDAFNSLRNMTMLCNINSLENHIDKQTMNELKKMLEEEPLAEFVVSLIENGNNTVNLEQMGMEIEAKEEKLVLSLPKTIGIKVEDNSMYPLIKHNDEIMIQVLDRYINGDILVVKINNENKMVIRQAVFLGNDTELIPLNKEYKIKTYKKDDITILGKVKKIITEI